MGVSVTTHPTHLLPTSSNMSFLNVVWPGNGVACWELWKCSPCCGDPCNFADGLYCCLTWYCCGPCNMGKLWSKTLNQECHIVNHCLPAWILGCIVSPIVRHNLRLAANVGSDDTMNWVGDFMGNGVRVFVSPFKMVKA